MEDIFSLKGRVALVTGAAQGIGNAIAIGLCYAGARVYLNDIKENLLAKAVSDISGMGYDVAAFAFDVTDCDISRRFISELIAKEGRLDILVNNAGIAFKKSFERHEYSHWNRVLDTNLSAYYNLARLIAPIMIQHNHGRIINIASVLGLTGTSQLISYVAAKHGVVGLTRALASELGRLNVNTNAICPGWIETSLTDPKRDANFYHKIIRRTPLGRWGKPHEIAGASIFLASEASSYVNGHTLVIDGGLTANCVL